MVNIRFAFPVTMFILAAVSFSYGAYQHFSARAFRATDSERLAFILETIEASNVSVPQKQQLYSAIATDLPAARPVLGLDFSGSFAAPDTTDQCSSDGQRTLCRALYDQNADVNTMQAVCGACNPK
jgi:hypothetical protein